MRRNPTRLPAKRTSSGLRWIDRGGCSLSPAFWRPRTGTRGTKAKPVTGEHLLYSFLTTEPNAVVNPIHPKAMPVILMEDD